MSIDVRLNSAAGSGDLVIFAGAGVSAGKPSSLPSWFVLNEMIAESLLTRALEAFQGYLTVEAVRPAFEAIGAAREKQHFPPEYQAQIIEELAGPHYFEALRSFDVDITNDAHHSIAALAATGAVAAIVTTNFDRLIERALETRHVPFVTAIDDSSFRLVAEALESNGERDLILLKVHGSVSSTSSLVDTLKQRKLGRGVSLNRCMDALAEHYFIFVGYSAQDLDGDRDYLRLVPNAGRGAGATYVVWPGAGHDPEPSLSIGAQHLMDAYGPNGSVVVEETSDFLNEVLTQNGWHPPSPVPTDGPTRTKNEVKDRLGRWASQMSTGEVGVALAALLEAAGEADTAARVLHRLVRTVMMTDETRRDSFYRRAQLHYGRLGVAWGRYVNVPDLFGAQSNASVESMQSLLRLTGTDLEVAASGWEALGWLWLGEGEDAYRALVRFNDGSDNPDSTQSSPEAWADSWIAAAQVHLLDAASPTISWIVESVPWARDRALEAGDVIRAARVLSLYLLALAETTEDVPRIVDELDQLPEREFYEASRVGDGVSLGFRELALGRWKIGPGGRDLASEGEEDPIRLAIGAGEHFDSASYWMGRQVMDPWQVFISLQRVRVLADLGQWEDVEEELLQAQQGLMRFPIWTSHFHETQFQLNQMLKEQSVAEEEIALAIAAADNSGLVNRRKMLSGIQAQIVR